MADQDVATGADASSASPIVSAPEGRPRRLACHRRGNGRHRRLPDAHLPSAERLDLATWRDLLIAGVALGSVYGLIALGYSLVYGILRMINFAHGEVFMAGAMVPFLIATRAMRQERVHGPATRGVAHGFLFVVGAARPPSSSRCCSSGSPTGVCGMRPDWCP